VVGGQQLDQVLELDGGAAVRPVAAHVTAYLKLWAEQLGAAPMNNKRAKRRRTVMRGDAPLVGACRSY